MPMNYISQFQVFYKTFDVNRFGQIVLLVSMFQYGLMVELGRFPEDVWNSEFFSFYIGFICECNVRCYLGCTSNIDKYINDLRPITDEFHKVWIEELVSFNLK